MAGSSDARCEFEICSETGCVISLYGEHDLSTRDDVLLALTLARSYPQLLVDLSACTFLDSSLINALLIAAGGLREVDGFLELVVPPGAHTVRRTLQITHVDAILRWHETRAAGLASAAARTIRAHRGTTRALRRIRAEIAHLEAEAEKAHAQLTARAAGVTVIRAIVADDHLAQSDNADQRGPAAQSGSA